jgi:hypothetical protein
LGKGVKVEDRVVPVPDGRCIDELRRLEERCASYERIAELVAQIVRADQTKGDLKYVHLGVEEFAELTRLLHSVGAVSSRWVEEGD